MILQIGLQATINLELLMTFLPRVQYSTLQLRMKLETDGE